MRLGHGGIGDRHLVCIIGGASDQILFDVEIGEAFGGIKGQEPLDLGHNFRADTVAGEQQEFIPSHARRPAK